MEIQQNHLESAYRAQRSLLASGIQSIVIGGLAVAIWGEPRATKDVDLKVLLQRDEAAKLLSALPSQYRLLSESPIEKLQQIGFLFTQDESGVRVDFLLTDHGFDIEAVMTH